MAILTLNTDIAPTILDYYAEIPSYYVGKSIKPTFNNEDTCNYAIPSFMNTIGNMISR